MTEQHKQAIKHWQEEAAKNAELIKLATDNMNEALDNISRIKLEALTNVYH